MTEGLQWDHMDPQRTQYSTLKKFYEFLHTLWGTTGLEILRGSDVMNDFEI